MEKQIITHHALKIPIITKQNVKQKIKDRTSITFS